MPPGSRKLAPGLLADDVACAAWEPNGGYGDGAVVAGDLLAAARARGVRYRPHTPVTALLTDGDRVTGVKTGAGGTVGREYAGTVVLAAGVWSPPLLLTAGVDGCRSRPSCTGSRCSPTRQAGAPRWPASTPSPRPTSGRRPGAQ